jgi:hypothetical protein
MKLDLGCGTKCKEGFDGVDIVDYQQKYVFDLRNPWPFENDSVDEVYSAFLLPCLTNYNGRFERVHFFNELFRVMKREAVCSLIIPSWSCAGGYVHPTYHELFYEGSLYFLNKGWRETNHPDTTQLYSCDFDSTWGYSMHPNLAIRNQEYQQFAIGNYVNAVLDIMVTLKRHS